MNDLNDHRIDESAEENVVIHLMDEGTNGAQVAAPIVSVNSFILDEQTKIESLNFKEILQLFGCAISQEQAWAVLNQCLNEFKYLMENNFELLHLNQDQIDMSLLNFAKDGSILFGFKKKSKGGSPIMPLKSEATASNASSWSSSTSSLGKQF